MAENRKNNGPTEVFFLHKKSLNSSVFPCSRIRHKWTTSRLQRWNGRVITKHWLFEGVPPSIRGWTVFQLLMEPIKKMHVYKSFKVSLDLFLRHLWYAACLAWKSLQQSSETKVHHTLSFWKLSLQLENRHQFPIKVANHISVSTIEPHLSKAKESRSTSQLTPYWSYLLTYLYFKRLVILN